MKLNATQLLEKVIDQKASDLHLSVGSRPFLRINTILRPVGEYSSMTTDDVEYVLSQILDAKQRELLEINKEIDFSISLGQKARFRVNAFFQKGYPSISLRHIPIDIPSFEQLHLPPNLEALCNLKQGLFLVVGPAGHGKSTTIASMIEKINTTRSEHIITIEDPIEYLFVNKESLIEQREMFLDTHSWDVALRSVLRQDPNVVFIGEMRDTETIRSALQIAETGHLVFTTLHTNSASQTIDRVISSFSSERQNEIKTQLSQVIEVVVSERLIPSAQYGVVPAFEIMVNNDAIANLIREGKVHMIDNVINTSAQSGMISLEKSIADLINAKLITFEDGIKYCTRPVELKRLVDRG
ncbi:PilT/PilU family type 4a pilus ATPase [candidate division WWE3 bacterium]|uniref:PilT/PilU family type 4a pilus ATPase n=1 Tax=candidate division WWE3 bacterium TaxID=2053526 RepID=A0A7X9E6U2_UNCKA|nr:PilT/PilU family type 4a pilus ATPase [candidate division WWE3 bacterium]